MFYWHLNILKYFLTSHFEVVVCGGGSALFYAREITMNTDAGGISVL